MSRWSALDVMRLQSLYESKASIAEMAQLLKRTPSAINKALERSGVRIQHKDRVENQKRALVDSQKWVSLEVVRKYLQNSLNTTDANPIRLLMMANRLRAEKKLPPFCVSGITW